MTAEAIEHYLRDRSHRAAAPRGSFTGSAGGAPCGDLIRVSIEVSAGAITAVTQEAEGCAASRAAAAAVAEIVDGLPVLEAALVGPERIAEELGGLADTHLHAAELAADALHRSLSGLVGSSEPVLSPPPRRVGDPRRGPGRRVLVALSGGVDSAVAALLERRSGAEVIAVTLKLWADPNTDGERSCCSPEAVLRARRLAHSLGIPHLTLDLRDRFRAGVVQPFIDGYAAGRTPNPCVLCNGELRLDAMLELAERLGATGLATGHYARVRDDGAGPLLALPADADKDQTYMLSALSPSSLRRMRFPLSGLRKPQVRELAARRGLGVASRAESQDLCFLAGEGKRSFLRRHGRLGERPGEIVDRSGRPLAAHAGHHDFTVGQRRGIGVAATEPLYVLATDAVTNRVTVGRRRELQTRSVRIRGARLHRGAERVNAVRLRYRAPARPCRLQLDGEQHDRGLIALAEPADRGAPGQLACLMDGDLVVGHATIV